MAFGILVEREADCQSLPTSQLKPSWMVFIQRPAFLHSRKANPTRVSIHKLLPQGEGIAAGLQRSPEGTPHSMAINGGIFTVGIACARSPILMSTSNAKATALDEGQSRAQSLRSGGEALGAPLSLRYGDREWWCRTASGRCRRPSHGWTPCREDRWPCCRVCHRCTRASRSRGNRPHAP